jgi:hypothetical protein
MADKVIITDNVHAYKQTKLYCPKCGAQGVIVDDYEDYYLGSTGFCLACNYSHHAAGDFYKMRDKRVRYLKSIDWTQAQEG